MGGWWGGVVGSIKPLAGKISGKGQRSRVHVGDLGPDNEETVVVRRRGGGFVLHREPEGESAASPLLHLFVLGRCEWLSLRLERAALAGPL